MREQIINRLPNMRWQALNALAENERGWINVQQRRGFRERHCQQRDQVRVRSLGELDQKVDGGVANVFLAMLPELHNRRVRNTDEFGEFAYRHLSLMDFLVDELAQCGFGTHTWPDLDNMLNW